MEDLILLILQGLGQFLLELLAYLPWDLFWYVRPENEIDFDGAWTLVVYLLSIAAGALLGWASLHYFPDVLLRWSWLRIASLVVSPLLSGLIAREMAKWRKEKHELIAPNFHFWLSLCFSAGFVVVRFVYAHRPV